MAKLTDSQKKILVKIKRYVGTSQLPYDFWFVYDGDEAIGWEGGFELGQYAHFRNQFTVQTGKQIKKNWE